MGWFGKKTRDTGDGGGPGPDFSAVDSREKVQALVDRGELVPMLLLPEAFGGEAIPPNILHVPPFAADLKASTDANVIAPLAASGKLSRYKVEPEYEGNSFVPIAVRLIAWDPGSFNFTVAIWGKALEQKAEGARVN